MGGGNLVVEQLVRMPQLNLQAEESKVRAHWAGPLLGPNNSRPRAPLVVPGMQFSQQRQIICENCTRDIPPGLGIYHINAALGPLSLADQSNSKQEAAMESFDTEQTVGYKVRYVADLHAAASHNPTKTEQFPIPRLHGSTVPETYRYGPVLSEPL
jgi:hypothetical protein